jgi:hypothetical protein
METEQYIDPTLSSSNIDRVQYRLKRYYFTPEMEMYVSSILNHHSKPVDISEFIYNFIDEKVINIKKQQCLDGRVNK